MHWLKQNAANLLTSLRIIFIPYLVYTALLGQNKAFVFAAGALYLTDILDGNVAKLLHTTSELGRKLDALADFAYYAAVLFLTLYFCSQDAASYAWLVAIPFMEVVLPKFLGLYYLKRVPTLHLRIWQFTALPGIIWALTAVYFGFNTAIPILVFVNILCLWGFVEEIWVYFRMKGQVDEDLKSAFDIKR